jgi:integrase
MAIYDTWKIKRGANKGKLKPPEKRRKKRWQVHWWDPFKLTGDGYRDTFFEVYKDAEDFDTLKKNEKLTGVAVDETKGQMLVREYAKEWLASIRVRKTTRESYERVLRLHVLPQIGHLRLRDVRRSHIQGWVTKMEEDGYAPNTINSWYGGVITGIFNSAVLDKAIPATPCVEIDLPDKVRTKKWLPTPFQVEKLYQAFTARFALVILLGAGCGIRWGEAMALTVTDVDLKRRKLKIHRQLSRESSTDKRHLSPPKTKNSIREIDLTEYQCEAIAAHIAAGYPSKITVVDETAKRRPKQPFPEVELEFLFPTDEGTLLYASDWADLWAKALVAAGEMENEDGETVGVFADAYEFTMHNLRHYFVSMLIDAGASVVEVQAAVGHADPATTLREYTHLWPKSEGKAVSIIEAAFRQGRAEAAKAELDLAA